MSSDGEEDAEELGFTKPSERFEGEDRSPTTTRELNGWYAYPVAAEVFAVVAVGAFLPVILEQLARENGVHFSDRTKPCVDKSDAKLSVRAGGQKEQCMVTFLGKSMSTSSFAMYTFSTAVLVQAITLVWFSSFADHGPYRKKMLLAFAYTGSVTSALFIFISPAIYYLAPILVIFGVTSLGCSFVLLNAFLPLLVANDASLTHGKSTSADDASDYELETLNPDANGHRTRKAGSGDLTSEQEQSAKISSKGVGYGYIAAVLVQILSIIILWIFSKTSIQKSNPSLPIRVILFLVGIWWALFTIPTLLWLRPRPGPPLPSSSTKYQPASSNLSSRWRTIWFYARFSLTSFWRTLLRALSLKNTRLFLLAWFLLSDAVATISGTAVLFARTELEMGTIAIAALSITSIGSGVVGAFAWPRVQRRFGIQPKTVLLCCVVGMEVIPLYGLLGFVPLFRSWGVIGLQKPWEIYPIAVLHGIVMGGISSYARSVYAPLIPEGREAAFFALYAVTDKGSSAVGPALVGWIVDRAGSIRPAFLFLAIVVVLPAPLLWWLDVEKGREDARALAEGAEGSRGAYERVEDE